MVYDEPDLDKEYYFFSALGDRAERIVELTLQVSGRNSVS
jgi:hypothetical protein